MDAFEVIEIVKDYEQDQFGEVTTDLSDPEKVVNMYAYIHGEHVLHTSSHLTINSWDRELTVADIEVIIEELS